MPNIKDSVLSNLNRQVQAMGANAIRAFDEEVSSVPNIIKLTLGEPDFNVPDHIKAAAIRSIEENDSHYAPASGSVAVRQAITDFLANRYGLTYNADNEIVVTVGATEAIYDCLATLLNPGDEVLIPTPIFSMYGPDVLLNGAKPIYLDTSANDFVLTPEQLRKTIEDSDGRAKVLILNFPSNPTGVTYDREALTALAAVIKETDMVVISDEIYSELTYNQNHVSMAELLPEQTLLLNGVSKSHAMTGYRIGFVAGPKKLVEKVNVVHQFTTTAASNPAMAATAEALGTPAGKADTELMKLAYQKRRDYLYQELINLGFEVPNPDGAFYIFAKIPAKYGVDDHSFALDLAKRGKVAVIPGSIFGLGGEGYVRISYAASENQIKAAVKRISDFMK